jgi:hypothetical protein
VAHLVVTELPALHYLGRGPASEVANLSSPISWSSTNSKEEEGEDRRELSPRLSVVPLVQEARGARGRDAR